MRAAVFDLDGTVLDSMWIWDEINASLLHSLGIDMPEEHMRTVNSMSFLDAAKFINARFGLRTTAEALRDQFMEAAKVYYAQKVSLKPGAGDYLFHLKRKGVPLAIATACVPDLFVPALKRHGLDGIFDAVVTPNDIARGKEFPDIYLEAARRLTVPAADCCVFEDILSGVRSAKRAGMMVVGVYDDSAKHDRDAIAREADVFIRDYRELL